MVLCRPAVLDGRDVESVAGPAFEASVPRCRAVGVPGTVGLAPQQDERLVRGVGTHREVWLAGAVVQPVRGVTGEPGRDDVGAFGPQPREVQRVVRHREVGGDDDVVGSDGPAVGRNATGGAVLDILDRRPLEDVAFPRRDAPCEFEEVLPRVRVRLVVESDGGPDTVGEFGLLDVPSREAEPSGSIYLRPDL